MARLLLFAHTWNIEKAVTTKEGKEQLTTGQLTACSRQMMLSQCAYYLVGSVQGCPLSAACCLLALGDWCEALK
jgi:hypothetical protein